MSDSLIYLENYLQKEIIVCKFNQSKEDIAKKFKINNGNIFCENNNLTSGDYFIIENNPIKIYIVKPSDTLESISIKFGLSIEEILNKNNTKKIFIGQQLFI